MIFERIKSEGISHNSYFIAAGADAAVIDPRRDCQVYADLASRTGTKVRHILETHRNEDYVIGSVELADLTGADIHHGPGLAWQYGNTLADGKEFPIGPLALTARRTPGHTDESVSYILTERDGSGATVIVFSGDTLFVGDVGRTDLYGPEQAPRLAGDLYDSIFNTLLPLGDGVILCPAHGGGSVCGMHIADRDQSTLGIERLHNPVLQLKTKERFVSFKVREKPERPPYFTRMEQVNLAGPPLLGCMPSPGPLSPAEFKTAMDAGAVVLDASEPAAFGGAHIKGAYSIWLDGLPEFAGWVLPYDRPILLVLQDEAHLDKAVRYLRRSGYDRIQGYLRGGTEGWYNAGYSTEDLHLITVHQLRDMFNRGEKPVVLDVRGQEEWDAGHIEGALHIYVGHLERRIEEVPRDRTIAVLCNVGHRAGLGASILLRAGFSRVHNVIGSMSAWRAVHYPETRA